MRWLGYEVAPLKALPGLFLLIGISLVGLFMSKRLPWKVPSMIYISAVAIVLSLPITPGSTKMIAWAEEINMLAITTTLLAYVAVGIGSSLADFAKIGWKSVIIGSGVLFGTFLGSAIIAEIVLRFQGVI